MSDDVVSPCVQELRAWLAGRLSPDWIAAVERDDMAAIRSARAAVDTRSLLHDLGVAGWATPDWPVEYGGRGLDRDAARLVAAELARFGVPRQYNVIGLAMAAPTLLAFGTESQKRHFLPAIARYDHSWCQLFSEPGAGSDLAGLATRAVPLDGGWLVNGQKVWSSMAHEADFGLLLARTDPSVAKHDGLSYFVLDMHAMGVGVRPLRQLNGDAEFNEVFLTDVFVPTGHLLGRVGEGWRVALATLQNERSALSGAGSVSGSNIGGLKAGQLMSLARERGREHDPRTRDQIAARLIDAYLLRAGNARAALIRSLGHGLGAEGAVTKLLSAEHNKRVQALVMDLLGAEGIAWLPDLAPPQVDGFLRAQANTIEGGTSEIMRTVIGERVLGLPREPDTSRGIPWTDIPRTAR